jgi:hypothetical protein
MANQVRIYVDADEVAKIPGLIKEDDRWITPLKTSIFWYDGRYYATVEDSGSFVPDDIMSMVNGVSYYGSFPCKHTRESGIYKLDTAMARVECITSIMGVIVINFKMTAKTIEDLDALYRKIRVGSIRPNPEDSFDGPQDGISREQLEAEHKAEIRRLHGHFRGIAERLDEGFFWSPKRRLILSHILSALRVDHIATTLQ